ncbi:MAG: DUF1738 domain-containing protein [Alphaproteobacteria bacterium]|nr:DUF1738 domain-containing protein [Alphaproteobacteria bacterium]
MADGKPTYRDEIAAEIIARIEAGTAPWQKPWQAGTLGQSPFNPVSGNPYHGINQVWLDMQGRSDPRWMTYKQALAQDAQVRKGEKAATVEYWKFTETVPVTDPDGTPVLGADGKPRTREVRLDRPRVFLAKVFNAEQIDGLAPYVPPPAPALPALIEAAEGMIASSGVPVFHDQVDRAFYRPSTDQIHLPPLASFHNTPSYYDTVLHELGHATGHHSRLARDFGPFGSERYAREELRAEIASYMLARDLGISFDPSNHASYVESWLKALREDKNEIFRAARDAETIKTWVMEPERRPELERATQEQIAGRQRASEVPAQDAAKTENIEMVDRLENYYRPGRVVPGPNGQDVVKSFERLKFGYWNVVLQAVRPDGTLEPERQSIGRPDSAELTAWEKDNPVPRKARQVEQPEVAMSEPTKTRHFIAVPFAEKDQAKAAGAKWDRQEKSWYVPEGLNPEPFAKWAAGAAPAGKEAPLSPIDEFAQVLKANGLVVEGAPVMDGKWHRVAVTDDKGQEKSGSYRGFLDGRPSGQITNYRGGDSIKWVATGTALTDEERARIQAEAANVRKARRQEQHELAERAAKNAYGVWTNLPGPATPDNCPYLAAKGVGGHGVKVNEAGQMVVPARDAAGRLWNIQTVTPDGKLYLKDSRKAGTMHVLEVTGKGTLDSLAPLKHGALVIAEGYATAATIHEATGHAVIVAFDSGNLKAVAEAVHAKYPDRPILIAADNDHARTKGNIGMIKAEEAAKAVGGTFVAPQFTAEEKGLKLTDFNDLAKSRGNQWVRRCIETALSRVRDHGLDRGVA